MSCEGLASKRYLHSFPTRRSSDLTSTCSCTSTTPSSSAVTGPRTVITLPGACGADVRTCAHPPTTDTTGARAADLPDRKSTRLNSSHVKISYAVFCLKKKTDRDPP